MVQILISDSIRMSWCMREVTIKDRVRSHGTNPDC